MQIVQAVADAQSIPAVATSALSAADHAAIERFAAHLVGGYIYIYAG